MRALAYLIVTQIKNKILYLKKKPALMVLYGIVALMLIASIAVVILLGSDSSKTSSADERILYLIIAGVGLLFVYNFTVSGLSTGSSLFTMPDVGLLFVAPISPKKILMYGLLSTFGKALLGSIFIFYQIGNLKSSFGYGFKEIFMLFIIFAIMLLLCQLLSIGIYIFSNGNNTRKTFVRTIIYSLLGILVLTYLFVQKEQIGFFETLLRIVASDGFGYFPVAGWAVMLFMGVVHNSTVKIIAALAMFFIMGTAIIILLTSDRADYYEDVLLSTEVTYQIKSAAKEGRQPTYANTKKIKLKDEAVGIGKGSKAGAIFYKHLLEHRRKSKLLFIDNYTLFMIIAVGIAGFNFKVKAAPDAAYYAVFAIAVYFQYFMTSMGKLRQELSKPYIYLIPDTSLNKLLAASGASLMKPCVDGICIFAVLAIASGSNIAECIFFAFAYAASGAVFVGLTILYQRVLGGQPSMLIKGLVGTSLLMSIMAPSIGSSVLAAFLLPESLKYLSILPYSVFCILFTIILFAICSNLIDKAEYTQTSGK